MEFKSDFISLDQALIHSDAQMRCDKGWRYVQILAVNKESSLDLVYSYMKDGQLDNMVIQDVPKDAVIPSISDVYFEAFVCENEIHDLFGLNIEGIAIDFLGNFYRVSEKYPMTIITPEQLAAREKARKVAAAKAAKEAKDAKKAKDGSTEESAGDTEPEKPKKTLEEERAELEAKLSKMDPEKAAKVRAAFEAKMKKSVKTEEGK